MREDLIAYALGELDEAECERVEQALADDPTLREELEQIEQCLADADCPDHDDYQPIPRGLADRTTTGIFSGCLQESDSSDSSTALGFSATSCIMSPIDMTVACGLLITIASLLMPALYNGRNQSQRVSCTNNLRELGTLLHLYAQERGGYFPLVRPNEHAGIFASRLREANLVRPDELDRLLICSSSPLAEQLAAQGRTFHVPSLTELYLANGMWRTELQRTSSGSYGCQVGYSKNYLYHPAMDRRNNLVPILADAPSVLSNYQNTDNHGGNCVNVLFQDGCVRSLESPRIPCTGDHLYFNRDGRPEAGTQWNDAVVLPSGATPGIEPRPMPVMIYRIFRVQ